MSKCYRNYLSENVYCHHHVHLIKSRARVKLGLQICVKFGARSIVIGRFDARAFENERIIWRAQSLLEVT